METQATTPPQSPNTTETPGNLEPEELEQLIRFYFRKGGDSRLKALMEEVNPDEYQASSRGVFALIPLLQLLREGNKAQARQLAASLQLNADISEPFRVYLRLLVNDPQLPAKESIPGEHSFARNAEPPFTTLLLMEDGEISGDGHPNEASWGLEDGHLVLYAEDKRPTSMLAYDNDRKCFIGPYLYDVSIHVLEPCNG